MIPKNYPNRIFLVGMPSCGKSTFGKKFAHYINYQFLDTDTWIEEKNKQSISAIFAQQGENYFRQQERSALEFTKSQTNTVIATGGGMPCFFDNILIINQLGFSVFLDVSPKQIANRIRQGDQTRPILQTQNKENLTIQIAQKYKERIAFYRQAHLTLEENEITPQILKEKIRSFGK